MEVMEGEKLISEKLSFKWGRWEENESEEV